MDIPDRHFSREKFPPPRKIFPQTTPLPGYSREMFRSEYSRWTFIREKLTTKNC